MKDNGMRIPDSCARCLYEKQAAKVTDPMYLEKVREMLRRRRPEDTSPDMVCRFTELYESMFGPSRSYAEEKKKYNDLVLSLSGRLEERIRDSEDPLAAALQFARIGNYIDFGAMEKVDTEVFLSLFSHPEMRTEDLPVYNSFLRQCAEAKQFLLIADNCGEIVLDKLFLKELKKRFPQLILRVMVRGGEVLNDATEEDACYVGMQEVAQVVSSGMRAAGTILPKLSEEARRIFDSADVRLAKGQGNYESLHASGEHLFFSFLCKCDLFTHRFKVPLLTGIFTEESE